MLETERLRLRPWTKEDAPEVERLVSAREIAATTGNIPHPYPKGAAAEWLARLSDHVHRFAIELRDDGTLVGAITLVLDEHGGAETGYWIGVPYWNNGYATEALRAVLGYGFRELALERIQAQHFDNNAASGRVMEKAGMHPEGVRRRAFRKWDELRDLHLYGILREEWSEH